MKTLALPSLALLLVVPLAHASPQRARHANDGDGFDKQHGHTLARAGDVNDDGVGDYWMGAPDLYAYGPAGSVYLVSGKNGATLRQIDGSAADERFGYALAGGRDLSGDGVEDVVVGAPEGGLGQRGVVRVFSGADGSLLREIDGRAASDRFGEALALLDDIDGDGVAELAIGAPGDERGASDGGSVQIHSGATGALRATTLGAVSSAEFGGALANAGDVNGDGRAELFVGASGGPGAGKARLFSGASGALLGTFAGDASGDRFGRAVSGSADLDGDGVRDLVVGAPGGSYVRAFSGASGAALWSATRSAPETGGLSLYPGEALFGWAVCGLDDQDRDGRAEVAVGYPEASSVWILSGRDGSTLAEYTGAALLPSTGESLFTYLGFALAPLGDLDGDGDEELALGAPLFSTPSGSMSFVSGRSLVLDGGLRRDWAVGGAGVSLGRTVSGAGDVDGDGRADVAYSASSAAGELVVVTSGRDRSVLRTYSGGGGFGRAIACAGDVDLDGVDDLLVGANLDDLNGTDSGSASVFSGRTGAVLHTFAGSAARDCFGTSVAALGDVNGDGHADVAVGAPRAYADPLWYGFCTTSPPPAAGYVRVYSGADGALLFRVDGQVPTTPYCDANHAGEFFGFSLTGVGDWNVDGVPDLAVGAPGAGEAWSGAVRVFSGIDGALLQEFTGTHGQYEFGVSVAGASDFDLDADGFVDLLVGEEEIYYSAAVSGTAYVFSSRTGTMLRELGGGAAVQHYGGAAGPAYAVAIAGDFDHDGHSDVAVGNPSASSLLGPGAGEVLVISGGNGGVLQRVTGTSSWDYLGYSIAAAGDVNGDGRTEIVIGVPTAMQLPSPNGSGLPNALARIRVLGPKPLRSGTASGGAVMEAE